MAESKTQGKGDKGKPVAGLRVASKGASFCRAGRRFTRDATDIPLAELSAEQVEALRTEPSLVVQDVEIGPVDAASA